MERLKIISDILDGSSTRLRDSYFLKNYPEIYEEINNHIDIIDISFKEKLWYYSNNIVNEFVCKCGNKTTFNKNWLDGYRKYCSTKCSHSDDLTKEKRKATTLAKYGVDNVAKLDSIKKKTEDTNLERYGTKSSFQNEDVKKKWKKNVKEKYGVNHIFQLDSFKDKRVETNLKKYGVKHFTQTDEYKENLINYNNSKYGKDWYTQTDECKEKTLNSNLEKFGIDHYSKTDEYKNRVKITNLDKYNKDWYCQSDDFKSKKSVTNVERYGYLHHMMSDIFLQKIKVLNIEKYGVDNIQKYDKYRKEKYEIANNENYIKYIDNSISLFKCDCNKDHEFQIHVDNYIKRNKENNPLCTICYPISDNSSIKEKMLLEFIQSNYEGEIISGYRDGLEIDIYLPELKLGFEFNGLYWHSNKYKDNNYHIDKTNYFKERDIRIIHIWEDDWTLRSDILKSQILNLLNKTKNTIFARKCSVIVINDNNTSSSFLNENHIQGRVNSCLKIGLYHNDELVSLMTFDHFEGRNRMSNTEWNLNRFCNKINTNIVGGASKLFKYFIKNYFPTRVISYADKDWSVGNLYYKLGFKNISESLPDYKYLKDYQRVHKSNYSKSRTKTLLTESQYASDNNLFKIYDCGKIKFEFILAFIF